jgi:hypothetical protein
MAQLSVTMSSPAARQIVRLIDDVISRLRLRAENPPFNPPTATAAS